MSKPIVCKDPGYPKPIICENLPPSPPPAPSTVAGGCGATFGSTRATPVEQQIGTGGRQMPDWVKGYLSGEISNGFVGSAKTRGGEGHGRRKAGFDLRQRIVTFMNTRVNSQTIDTRDSQGHEGLLYWLQTESHATLRGVAPQEYWCRNLAKGITECFAIVLDDRLMGK